MTTPLETLADSIKLLNDRERLLLIDWLADGFDDFELTDGLHKGMLSCFPKAEEVMPDHAVLGYPANPYQTNRWREYRAARDERLNQRLGQGK